MKDFSAYLYGRDLSHSSVKYYVYYVEQFRLWLDKEGIVAQEATGSDIMAYLDMLKKKELSNVTRSLHLIAIRHYMDYLGAAGLRVDNPAAHIHLRGVKRTTLYPPLSMQQLESLYERYQGVTDSHPKARCNWFPLYRLTRHRNRVMLGLLIWQGLTTSEIVRLKVSDVHLREGYISIAGTRRSAARELMLKPQQIMELMEYLYTTRQELLRLCAQDTAALIIAAPTAGSRQASGQQSMHLWKQFTKELRMLCGGLVNLQQIRASVITQWLRQYNLREAQYMAGHKSVGSTEAYRANQVEELQQDIEQFHPIG